METIFDSLKLVELKQDGIRKSFDQAHEEASSILSLTLQLKDFEEKFELAKDCLIKQAQELEKREQKVEMKLKKIDEPQMTPVLAQKEVEECGRMLIMKRKELALVQKEHQECIQDLTAKKKQLGAIMKSIEDHGRKFKSEETKLGFKEKELSKVQKLIGETSNDLYSKEKHLHSIKERIRDCTEKLEDKEKKYRSLNLSIDKCSAELARKQKHLDSVKAMIMKKNDELEAKEKQYDSVNNSMKKCSAVLAEKQKELELIDKSIRECSSKLQLEEKKLGAVENYAKELARTLESKEKDLKSHEEKMKSNCEDLELKINAIQESIRERNGELALKEEALKSIQISISESSKELEAMKKQEILPELPVTACSKELESKMKNLDLVERSSIECYNERTSKEAELESMGKRASEFHKELEEKLKAKERQFEANAEELELKNKEIVSLQKLVDELSKKLDDKEKQLNDKLHSEVTIVPPDNLLTNCDVNSSSVDYQSSIADNGKYLQLLLNESFRKQDSVYNEVFNAIQKSMDPGKLVLDAMQGFYPADLKEQDIEFDSSVIRRSCTTLLEQLLKISPKIKPEVREEAMKLALEWKSRIKTPCENSLEVSGLLQLLAAFKLSCSFSHDEQESFLYAIYQNRQALQLRQALGFAEGLSVSDLEQIPALQSREPEDSSTATIDERTCPLILEDNMDSHDLMPHEVFGALRFSADPANFVLDMMHGSYSQHCKNGGAGLDESVVKNKILLMDQLIKVSPIISLRVREEAMKLAVLWKQNVTLETVKGMEVWAFLLFLTLYRLISRFSSDEILRLLVKVAYQRHAPDLCQILGFTDKIPKLIQILLKTNQYIEAARFSCAFGLLHIFPLNTILQKCVEHVWKYAQEKAMEKELYAHKAILQCISDYKLESIYDTLNLLRRIVDLEKQRANNTAPSLVPAFSVQHPVQSGNYLGIDVRGSNNQPSFAPFVEYQLQNRNSGDEVSLRGNNKRPRIDMSVDDRIFLPRVTTPSNQQ